MQFSLCGFRYLMLVALLFVADRNHAGQLYTVSLKTGEIRQLTDDSARAFGSPDWSPDDKRIALDTWLEGVGGTPGTDVAIVDVEASTVRQLGHGAMPSWSPDGKRFVCHTYMPENQIVVVNADGSGREVLLDQWGSPRWSPDGQTIVSLYRGGLASFDLATGKQTVLLGSYGVRYGFSISPNGKRLCISTGGRGLGIVNYDETLQHWEITDRLPGSYGTGHTSWAPDGKRVVLLIQDEPPAGSVAADPEGKPPYRLYLLTVDDDSPPIRVPGVPLDWECIDADWSNDGEWIAFIRVIPEKKEEK